VQNKTSDRLYYCEPYYSATINFVNIWKLWFLQENYTKYNGFVILHGTDTMAYTASALSFMLENLGKPVILTGSQVHHGKKQ